VSIINIFSSFANSWGNGLSILAKGKCTSIYYYVLEKNSLHDKTHENNTN
jgi:hypothetical protein